MGRPSSYHPNYWRLLEHHFSADYSLESFLVKYQIPRRTFYNWISRQGEFTFANEMADRAPLRFWGRMLIDIATGNILIVYPNYRQSTGLPKIVQTVLACHWPVINGPNACETVVNPWGLHNTRGSHAKTFALGNLQ